MRETISDPNVRNFVAEDVAFDVIMSRCSRPVAVEGGGG